MKILVALALLAALAGAQPVVVNTEELELSFAREAYSLKISDRKTKEVLLQSAPNEALAFGQWQGIYLPIYFGYELREGKSTWQTAATSLISTSPVPGGGLTLLYRTANASVNLNATVFELRARQFTLRLTAVGATGHEALEPKDYAFPYLRAAFTVQDKTATGVRDGKPAQTAATAEQQSRNVRKFGNWLAARNVSTPNRRDQHLPREFSAETLKLLATEAAFTAASTGESSNQAAAAADSAAFVERFYGFGQQWGGTDMRGQKLYCWTEDGAWAFLGLDFRVPKPNATYIPMPWLLSSRGYGFWADTPYRTEFDLAASDKSRWIFTAEASSVDLVFFMGKQGTIESFEAFNKRRGITLIPSPWVFGPWKQMSSVVVNASDFEIAQRMINRDIPVSVHIGALHFFPTGDQRGREDMFVAENKQYHQMGLKSICYFNPYVSSEYKPLFEDLIAKGWFLKNSSGLPYLFVYFGDVISRHFFIGSIDFSNPNATKWYVQQMQGAIDMGFDGWMYDFAEYTPQNSFASDKHNGRWMHNRYPELYQQAAYSMLLDTKSRPNPALELLGCDEECAHSKNEAYSRQLAADMVFFARSGYTASGLYSITHWTGDASADWNPYSGLPAHVEACLSLGISGVPNCASQIGGYVCELYEPTSPELLIRWLQLGAFSGTMQDETQGSQCHGRAQMFTTPEIEFNWRKFSKLRTALFPYIYTAAHQARANGIPITRHHVLSFPNDQVAITQRYQYLFGDSILVAPVVNRGQTQQSVYLPLGANWIDVASSWAYDAGDVNKSIGNDGRFRIGAAPILAGGSTQTVTAALSTCPLFVRAGSIVATLDPSVFTLNRANFPGVVSLFDRADILHLWAFPDRDYRAQAALWDGSSYSLSPCSGNTTTTPLCFTARDTLRKLLIVQLQSARVPTGVATISGGRALPQAANWQALAAIEPRPTASAFVHDRVQSVLWVRLVAADFSGVRVSY